MKKDRFINKNRSFSFPQLKNYFPAPIFLISLETFLELLNAKKPSIARKPITISSVIPIIVVTPFLTDFLTVPDNFQV